MIAVHAILTASPCPQLRGSNRYVSSADLEDGYGRTSTQPAYRVETSSKNLLSRRGCFREHLPVREGSVGRPKADGTVLSGVKSRCYPASPQSSSFPQS